MKKIKIVEERILDWRVQKAYAKYQKYLAELSIYEECSVKRNRKSKYI